MLYLKFKFNGKIQYGLLENNQDKKIKIISANFLHPYELTGKDIEFKKVHLLSPVNPSKVIAVGLNYKDHIKELHFDKPPPKTPCLFLKAPTSVIGPEEHIIYPSMVNRLDYEAELAIIIKNKIKDLKQEEVQEHILGYSCLNDVTGRDLQKEDGQWTRAKSFDTFCPLGPYVANAQNINGNNLKIESYLNGELKQQSNTHNFLFTIEEIVSFVSQVMTLLPGDVIATGTPAGVGPMHKGDTIEIKIEKIGILKNYVK